MKHLGSLGFTIAALIAPIQVQAQARCVTFPEKSTPEAQMRYLLSHPGTVACSAYPPPDYLEMHPMRGSGASPSTTLRSNMAGDAPSPTNPQGPAAQSGFEGR
jgi:hypothetical protein